MPRRHNIIGVISWRQDLSFCSLSVFFVLPPVYMRARFSANRESCIGRHGAFCTRPSSSSAFSFSPALFVFSLSNKRFSGLAPNTGDHPSSTHAYLSAVSAKLWSCFECSSLVFSIELGLLTTLIIHALTCVFQNMQQLSSSVRNLRERLTLAAWLTNIPAWITLSIFRCYMLCVLSLDLLLSPPACSHDPSTNSSLLFSASSIQWVNHTIKTTIVSTSFLAPAKPARSPRTTYRAPG